ncbi:MAG TPA: AraC family transcriptional regulator [Flavobacteriales bacterium]|nr:AraC family transcriptional regulator [Flavobacteriales bacterium]
MNYHYQKVNPLLSEYIRTVLILEDAPENNRNKLPLFTNGTPALLCRTQTTPEGIETISQLTLYGTSAPTASWDITKNETLIAYFFKPFSMPCLFNISASELVNKKVAFSTWNAHKTNALKTQLAYSKSFAEKINALDNLLLGQLELQRKECEIISRATDAILLHSGKEILTELLNDLNLTERTFQRIFKKFVGITPTQYRRICQFKDSFEKLKSGAFEKMTDVAYQTGFADQSHFIRSFKEHSQTTPGDYVKSGLRKK